MEIYSDKHTDYFLNARTDLISLLPANPANRILEIGAGGGNTLVMIKEKGLASEVVGVELFDIPNSNQRHPHIDRFIIGNLEHDPLHLSENYFDAIICGDVLEHLVDPWTVVKNMAALLKKGGLLITSTPNFREFKTLYKVVVKGDFGYEQEGILDKTHLRFFCKKNLYGLFNQEGLQITAIHSGFQVTETKNKRKWLNVLTLGLLKDFLTSQYLVVAQKT